MSNNRNKFEQANKKKQTLGALATVHTKGDLKATAIETVKDVVVGIVAGGLTGALIGRPSLGIGLLVTGFGHYKENRLISTFGIGMMAANGFQGGGNKEVNGLGIVDGAKARLMNFKDSFTQKLYLDKIIRKKEEKGTEGVGEVKYFLYPGQEENKQVDLSALNLLESQLVKSAVEHEKKNNTEAPVEGTLEQVILDPTKVNY